MMTVLTQSWMSHSEWACLATSRNVARVVCGGEFLRYRRSNKESNARLWS